jgi:hypothetical protein
VRKVILIILVLLSKLVMASLPGPAYPHDIYSQNEHYYFHAVPFENYDWTKLGKTIVYDSKTKKELYRISEYVSPGSFITNNGRTVIDIEHTLINPLKKTDEETIMIFFVDGKKVREFNIANVYNEKLTIQIFERVSYWEEHLFIHNDILYILTFDDQVILLNANDGELIAVKDKEIIQAQFDFNKLPQLRSIEYTEVKYPDIYGFPDLIDGNELKTVLMNHLNMKAVEEGEQYVFYVWMSVIIDRKGSAKVYYLNANKKGSEEELTSLKDQIEKWFKNAKFKTNLLPPDCDEWVFKDFLYLVEK